MPAEGHKLLQWTSLLHLYSILAVIYSHWTPAQIEISIFFPHKVPYFMSLTDILSFHQLISMEFTACYQIAAICSCLPVCQPDCFCSFPMWGVLGHASKWARLTAPGSQGSAISGRDAMRQVEKWEGKLWLAPVTARDPQEPPTWWRFVIILA